MSETIARPASGRKSSGVIIILLTLIIAALLLWHFNTFASNKKLAIVTSGDGPYWDLVLAGAQDAAKQYNIDLTVVRSKSNPDVQSASIQGLLGNGYDGIAISPISPVNQTVLMGHVATETTLLTFDSDIPVSRRLCFVGTDNYSAGRSCGEQVRQAMPDGGEVVVTLGNADKDNTQRRRQGLVDELLERSYEPLRPTEPMDAELKGPKYTVVATLVDNSDPAKAVELAAQAMKDHPKAKCYVGLLSYSAPAIVDAVDKAKPAQPIQIIGFDASDKTLELVEAGKIRATLVQDQYGCGYQAIRILADNAHQNYGGLPMFQNHTLACEVVNKDNIAKTRERLQKHAGGATTPAASPAAAVVGPT